MRVYYIYCAYFAQDYGRYICTCMCANKCSIVNTFHNNTGHNSKEDTVLYTGHAYVYYMYNSIWLYHYCKCHVIMYLISSMQPLSGSGHHVVYSWELLVVVLVTVKVVLGVII